MASKWEQQVLGGLVLVVSAIIIYIFTNQLPDDYRGLSFISVPVFFVGIGFVYYGIKTKQHSLR